ncbi:SHOCT domain-containing protein [Embleya hyalina]|nr:SHOCT domain-containing protein [Embleya hyalina]
MDWEVLADLASDLFDGTNTVTQAADTTAVPGEAPVWTTSARARQEWSNGRLALTTHRLIYAKDGRPTTVVPLAGITDVRVTRSRLTGNVLRITGVGGAHSWENVGEADTFAARLREAVTAADVRHAVEAATLARSPGGSAMLDELERLALLHRHGALTDEEFSQAKKRLVGG